MQNKKCGEYFGNINYNCITIFTVDENALRWFWKKLLDSTSLSKILFDVI